MRHGGVLNVPLLYQYYCILASTNHEIHVPAMLSLISGTNLCPSPASLPRGRMWLGKAKESLLKCLDIRDVSAFRPLHPQANSPRRAAVVQMSIFWRYYHFKRDNFDEIENKCLL